MPIAAKTYLPEEAELTVKEVRRGKGCVEAGAAMLRI